MRNVRPETYADMADAVLAGTALSRAELCRIMATPDDRLGDLLAAAFVVRQQYFDRQVRLQMLVNAQSGKCAEKCRYCAQSMDAKTDINVYPLISDERLFEGAQRACVLRARRYCIVTSGKAPSPQDIDRLCHVVREIRRTMPISICCSLGMVTFEQAQKLRAAGVSWFNHNLNTSERFYADLCSSHSYADRVRTIRTIKQAGLNSCGGGIVGTGETDDDLVDMALACDELNIDAIPVNFFHPVAGTPAGDQPRPSAERCLKALCLFRFANPSKEIRIAAGRELNLGPRQIDGLYPANSLFVNGYLTTSGESPDETHRLIDTAGFTIDRSVDD